jgi:hypothetical protein
LKLSNRERWSRWHILELTGRNHVRWDGDTQVTSDERWKGALNRVSGLSFSVIIRATAGSPSGGLLTHTKTSDKAITSGHPGVLYLTSSSCDALAPTACQPTHLTSPSAARHSALIRSGCQPGDLPTCSSPPDRELFCSCSCSYTRTPSKLVLVVQYAAR